MINMKRLGFGIPLLAAALTFGVDADSLTAQEARHAMHSHTGVAVLNESHRDLRVFAFTGTAEDRVLLGWVGGEELEYFQVPEEARTDRGTYRIAVQPVTPSPQIGVDASPHPLEVTPTLSPDPLETVRVVVDDEFDLSITVVR
jgi:hypothetical protein